MKRPPVPEEDFLYELKDLLSDAVENRRWLTVEEAFEMVLEQLGEKHFDTSDEEDEY